jgi:tetratricopeptide (TPR) repeat protein
MRHTARSSFLIRDLSDCDSRQPHPGAIKIVPRLTAAALVDAARSSSHRKLAEAIQLGEFAQSIRSADGLSRASQNILNLPLGKVADSIGRYYRALTLNRQGPHAFPEANEILIDVADHGPPLFRSKAGVARATNLRNTGDSKAALEIHAEAVQIAGSCEHGTLHPLFFAALQCALIKFDEGDYRGALAAMERLEPLAKQIGLEFPALLHIYYNNLAFSLIANGRVEETSRLSEILLASPFLNAYPEWQKTCADIALKTQPRSRSFVSMSVGKPFTGEPEALTDPVTLPESCGESLRRAEIFALLLVKVVCQKPRRIPIRLFSGQLLRRPFIAARKCAVSPRIIRAYLQALRWSYLRLYPAYPRPPTV